MTTTDNAAAIAANRLGADLYVVRAGERIDNRRGRTYAREVLVTLAWPKNSHPQWSFDGKYPEVCRRFGMPPPVRTHGWVDQAQAMRFTFTFRRDYERPSQIEEDRAIESWAEREIVPGLLSMREAVEADMAGRIRAEQVAADADTIASYVARQAYEEASREIRYDERLADLRRERREARARALAAGIAEVDALCDRSEREGYQAYSSESREVAKTVLRARMEKIGQDEPVELVLPSTESGFWPLARQAAADLLGVRAHMLSGYKPNR